MRVGAGSLEKVDFRHSHEESFSLKELVRLMVQSLVDQPEAVEVNEVRGNQLTILELRLAKSDLGKAIGKNGRTAQAMRTILSGAAAKMKKRVTLEILEPDADKSNRQKGRKDIELFNHRSK